MIDTTIPYSEFDDPDCSGCLTVIGRAGFFVDFICNECGAAIACAPCNSGIPYLLTDALAVLESNGR